MESDSYVPYTEYIIGSVTEGSNVTAEKVTEDKSKFRVTGAAAQDTALAAVSYTHLSDNDRLHGR